MGLFSFGNKDASTTSGRGNSASGAASGRAGRRSERAERVEAGEGLRRRRRGEPADANMLDPTLPEKQRARRRLIGAIALVLAAVVILPMVLDSHPKPATDGIAIEIPAHDDSPAPAAPAQSSTTAYEAAAGDRDDNGGDNPPAATDATNGTSSGGANSANNAAAGSNKGTAANSASANGTKSSGTKSAASGKSTGPGNATSSGNSTAATHANTPDITGAPGDATDKTGSTSSADTAASRKTTAAKAPTANDAPPAGSHFVVQIGSFSTDAPAQAWVTRLKAAGVPAYVQHSRQDDGSTRVLVRAGPFADRAAAETAVRKVRSVDAPEDANASAASQ
jgi:DedD protein